MAKFIGPSSGFENYIILSLRPFCTYHLIFNSRLQFLHLVDPVHFSLYTFFSIQFIHLLNTKIQNALIHNPSRPFSCIHGRCPRKDHSCDVSNPAAPLDLLLLIFSVVMLGATVLLSVLKVQLSLDLGRMMQPSQTPQSSAETPTTPNKTD